MGAQEEQVRAMGRVAALMKRWAAGVSAGSLPSAAAPGADWRAWLKERTRRDLVAGTRERGVTLLTTGAGTARLASGLARVDGLFSPWASLCVHQRPQQPGRMRRRTPRC
jgi:hypothetical protein